MLQAKRALDCEDDRLPRISPVAAKALRLLQQQDSGLGEILPLLETAPDLSRRIAQHTTFSDGYPFPKDSKSQANGTTSIGSLKQIVLVISLYESLAEDIKYETNTLTSLHRSFWIHTIGVAVAADILAEKLRFNNSHEAFAAGLLHDIGKYLCYFHLPDHYEKVCTELFSLNESGARIPGNLHLQTSEYIASQWGLPENYTRSLWMLDNKDDDRFQLQNDDLFSLVCYADALCESSNIGSGFFLDKNGKIAKQKLERRCLELPGQLSLADLDIIQTEVKEKVHGYAAMLGFWNGCHYEKSFEKQNDAAPEAGNFRQKNLKINRLPSLTFTKLADLMSCLSSALSIEEASRTILTEVAKGFGVKRGMSLVYNPSKEIFTGHLIENSQITNITVGGTHQKMRQYLQQDHIKDIEYFGILNLAMALSGQDKRDQHVGPAHLLSGVGGLFATFFGASEYSLWSQTPILGGLVFDVSDNQDVWLDPSYGYKNKISALSMVIGTAIERIVLSQSHTEKADALTLATEQLEESQKQLFHLHRLATVGQLAAGAAHEINNPLTIISINIQLMTKMVENNPALAEMADHLQMIAAQEKRVTKIAKDMLDFSRPAQPQLRVSSASAIINNVVSVLGTRRMMQNVKIFNHVDRALPSILVDPKQLEQVFMNLIINAGHAMPEGGEINITGQHAGEFVEINVADTGEGIAEDDLARIFDPFFSTKIDKGGSGLGLAISASIIDHNGGRISVESKPACGTTFTLQLPIDKECLLKTPEKEKNANALPIGRDPDQANILIIDDDKPLNQTLHSTLAREGYRVESAFDGIEGVQMMRLRRYHLLLLDIRMPRKDGMEVLKVVKEEFPDLKTIVITGHLDPDELLKLKDQGAFACLKKPFRIENALETIAGALQRN